MGGFPTEVGTGKPTPSPKQWCMQRQNLGGGGMLEGRGGGVLMRWAPGVTPPPPSAKDDGENRRRGGEGTQLTAYAGGVPPNEGRGGGSYKSCVCVCVCVKAERTKEDDIPTGGRQGGERRITLKKLMPPSPPSPRCTVKTGNGAASQNKRATNKPRVPAGEQLRGEGGGFAPREEPITSPPQTAR